MGCNKSKEKNVSQPERTIPMAGQGVTGVDAMSASQGIQVNQIPPVSGTTRPVVQLPRTGSQIDENVLKSSMANSNNKMGMSQSGQLNPALTVSTNGKGGKNMGGIKSPDTAPKISRQQHQELLTEVERRMDNLTELLRDLAQNLADHERKEDENLGQIIVNAQDTRKFFANSMEDIRAHDFPDKSLIESTMEKMIKLLADVQLHYTAIQRKKKTYADFRIATFES
jgi:hypothetical protein